MARKLKYPFNCLAADGDSMLLEGAKLGDINRRLRLYAARQAARGIFPVFDAWVDGGGVVVARYEDLPPIPVTDTELPGVG